MNSLSLEAEITLSPENRARLRALSDADARRGGGFSFPLMLGDVEITACFVSFAEVAQPTREDEEQVRVKVRLVGY